MYLLYEFDTIYGSQKFKHMQRRKGPQECKIYKNNMAWIYASFYCYFSAVPDHSVGLLGTVTYFVTKIRSRRGSGCCGTEQPEAS